MHSNFSPFNNEEDLRAENNFLKMKLMLEQGAQFGTVGNNTIPAAIEHEFLQSIINFEKQAENDTQIKVYDKIGRPDHFKSIEDITEADIPIAWEQLSDHLLTHGISLEVCSPNISVKELYRFTLEELFDEEVEDIYIPGLTHCFIYDIFHPDIVFENTRIAKEECLEFILEKMPMQWTHHFRKENLQLNNHYSLCIDEFTKKINQFKNAYDELNIDEIKETVCIVNEKESWVTGIYKVNAGSEKECYQLSGKWKVVFEKDDHLDYWFINGVIIEGIDF